MSLFEEYMKKIEEKSKTPKNTSSRDSTNSKSSSTTNSSAALERFFKRIDEHNARLSDKVDSSGVESWFSETQSTLKSMQDYYNENDGKWDSNFGGDTATKLKELLNSSGDVYNYLNNHRNEYEDYETLSRTLNEYRSALQDFDLYNYQTKRTFSKYGSNEEYENAIIGWLTPGASTDMESVSKRTERYNSNKNRIAELEKQIDDIGFSWWFTDEQEDKKALRAEKEALEAENRRYEKEQLPTDKYTTPVTDKFLESASKRDYSNATMEELWKYDSELNQISQMLTNNSVYTFDDEYNIVNNYTGKIEHKTSDLTKAYIEGNKESFFNTVIPDKLGMFLSATDEELDEAYNRLSAGSGNFNDTWANTLRDGDVNGWKYLTEGEINIYYDLLNRKGQESAYQYLDDMTTILTKRETEKRATEIAEAPLLDQIFMNLASVPMNVVGGATAFVDDAINIFQGEDINPYSRMHSWQNDASVIRQETAKDINNLTGNISLPLTGFTFGDVYQALMSSADSAVGLAIGSNAYGVLMGMGAASSEMKRLYEQGASTGQMIAGGLLAGAAEMVFEKVSLDNLVKMGDAKTIKGVIINALKQGGVEATEEMATEIANTITNSIVMGSQSDWVDMGTFVKNVVNAGLGGFISGGTMGGTYSAINKALYDSKVKEHGAEIIDQGGTDALKQLALEMYSDKSNKEAKSGIKLANKVGEKASAKNVGKLSAHMGETNLKQNKADIASALESKGMSKTEAKATAEIITKADNNVELTKAEQKKYDKLKEDGTLDAVLEESSKAIGEREINLLAARLGISPSLTKKDSAQQAEDISETENPTTKENATQSDFGVSESGKTIVKETGSEVNVAEIVSNESGNLMLKLDSGETVNAKDLAFATDEALVYEMVANMGVNPKTATALVRAYNPASGVKPQTYAIDIPLAYQYGKIGYEKGLAKLNLTPEQRNIAYVLGRDDVRASGRTWSDTSRKTPETNRSRASDDGIIYEGFELNEDALTDVQKASLAGIRTLAKMSPSVEFHVYESIVENGKKYAIVNGKKIHTPNGFFRNGNEIYIDMNAGKGTMGAMLYTASHEVVHFIAENSFDDFVALADFLFEHYGENNVPVEALIKREIDKLKKSYKAENKPLPDEKVLYMKAYEEVVANAMSKMFADPKAYEKLAKLKSENLSLWEKIGEAIKHMLDKLKSLLGIYEGRTPDQMAAHYVEDFSAEVYDKLQDLYIKGYVNAQANYEASIGTRKLEDFADAKNTEGDTLLQYKAMEADEDTYREMLKKWGKMTDTQINNLFLTIDNAMELIKDNLEALDYAWEADIDDRAYSPVKPNSDKLYQVSLDFSTLCRKRLLQQMVQTQLQEALNKPLTKEEGIAIRDALIAIQEEGRQIEVACALCYVESARMKSPEQIRKFMNNREQVIKEFFAGKSGGSMKEKLKKAEADAREKLHKENPDGIRGKDGKTMLDPRTASLRSMPKKYADEIRAAKRQAKASYNPTAEEQKLIDIAKGMRVSDFTSPEGLENLAKNYRDLFDAYTSYVRNATKSKGIEGDTWWRAGDSMQIGDVLIANMNRENGLRSQSWSDFQVVHILDYIAATIELATRNTKEQAYTKVPDFAELMGNTGVMINLSLIPTAKFNGKLEYDSVEGIDYKRSLELRDKYHATVGTICIGVDNVQIQMLLGDVTVDYVIPYHKSGMSAVVRKAMHIPTWSQYEEYQSEKNLSRADAEKQAKKYGVKLLAENDPKYHKETSFSEWFDIKEAQQIAKIENANPSDKAKQKKYGVMYGGYMAMQNAANNYLKLCAERGISPKFSHEKADFTIEENYWKLLIDRKMVDNVTGEVIEQQTIKPIFDEAEVMRILNDELDRYPKVKEDQEYAIRKVTEAYLSGDLKGGMSAKDIAKVMQTPVDNVSNVNIFASTEGDTLYSMDDDFEEDSLDKYRQNSYNLYTTTNEYQRVVTPRDKRTFARSLANKTLGMSDGDTKTIHIYCRDKVYTFVAYAYMRGYISTSEYVDVIEARKRRFEEYYENDFDSNRTVVSLWSKPIPNQSGRQVDDVGIPSGRRGSTFDDPLPKDTSNSTREGNNERVRKNTYSQKEVDEIVKKLREMYGLDDNKHSDEAMEKAKYLDGADFSNGVTFKGKPFWIAVVNQRTGNIEKTWTYEEAESVDFNLDSYIDILEEDGYLFFTTDLLQDNNRIEYDDYGNKLSDFLIKRINEQIVVKPLGKEISLVDRIRDVNHELGKINKTINNTINYISGIEKVREQLENKEITLKQYKEFLRQDKWYREHDDKANALREELDALIKELEATEGKPWSKLRSEVLYSTDSSLNSVQDTDSVSTRSLLANALESTVQNDIERNKLAQYKGKIALIESEYEKLSKIKKQANDLRFTKGRSAAETKKMNDLDFEANQIANRINTYDRQLLNLESTTALKNVLQREKEMARRKEAQKNKDILAKYREKAAETQRELMSRYQESRKKGVESRHKTEMRNKIKDVVNDLNQYLLKGTKDKHVPIELQKAVAEALDAVNMDTVGAEQRIAKKRAEMMSAKTPETIEKLAKEIERIQKMGDRMDSKLQALKAAYDEIKTSKDPMIVNSHDEVISNSIASVIKEVGKTPLRDMSLSQLESVYDMYRMVLTTIRNTNKAFKAAKGEEISTIANGVIAELDAQKKSPKIIKGSDKFSAFDWNNLKPVYAFERIGSANFTKVFKAVRAGEDTWATDMSEAQAFLEAQKKKHGYNTFDFNKGYDFVSSTGLKFTLRLDQIMSLYAYSKRGTQAKDHLKYGGFQFDGVTEFKEKKGKVVNITYQLKDTNAYKISDELLNEIIGVLDKVKGAKDFVDEMQEYLSSTMGEKGNEVSLAMYDVKLFKEKNYFPLKVSHDFLARAREQAMGEVKIKNSGFTKETNPNAKNTIVLTSFMDVWANHVNDMSMYHAFTLPLEDFYRVFNYDTPSAENMDSISVVSSLRGAHRDAAVNYIDQLLKDINGGARSDPRENIGKALMSNFKKASVMASLSVVVQQPTAIVRATALVDSKYFVGKPDDKKHKQAWEEVKQYAPIAIIKEMGYFDTGMGRSSVEWLKGEKTLKDKIDDAVSKAPALADESAWIAIWNAVKRETLHTHKNLRPNSEEFLKAVAERFTEVIVKTQVYDSTLARSANMRSKGAFMNMVTSFMAEPTTSINMLQDAFRKGKKGKYRARVIGAVYGSVVLNSALVSLIYAMRDDDEDETFIEKYLSRFTTEVLDGINPLTYIPFVKDIWSIAQGFDVERADMSLITDLFDSLQQMVKVIGKDTSDMDENELDEHNKAVNEALLGITDNISSLFGVPIKNVRRDINGIINFFKTIKKDIDGRETTTGSLGDNILEDVKDSTPIWGWLPNESKGDKLYDAIISGDTAYVDRLKSGYKSERAYESALRKALRENDPRIKEAAEASYNGNTPEYSRIFNEIIDEGNFELADIKSAINSEINKLEEADETEKDTDPDELESIYEVEHYYAALVKGDNTTANMVKEDIIKTEVANGEDSEDAEKAFESAFRSYIGKLYKDSEVSHTEVSNMLTKYGGYDSNETYWKLKEWDYKKEYGEDAEYSKYDTFYDAVKTGKNLKAVIKEYTDHGVKTSTLASQITSYYKPIYKDMTTAERANLKGYLLNAYEQLGYKRNEKIKDINKWLKDED